MTGYQSKRAAAQAIDKVNWADHEPNGLAQPAQEPQVCCGEYDTCLRACTPRGRHLAQPEQEPVGKVGRGGCIEWRNGVSALWTDLYTTPPQRPWVGLTDEEYAKLAEEFGPFPINQIEAKLKEKNT